MDWDTGFLADPKFQHLRDLLPDPIQFGYAGFSYLRLSADAWRTCERHALGDIVRGIEPWAGDALRDAGLLDDDFRLPETSFDKWVGSGIMAREVWAEKKRKGRESHRVPETPQVSTGLAGTPPTGRIGRESTVEPVEQVGTDEGVQGEDAVFTFLAQHGAFIREDAPLGRRLLMLMDRRTPEAVLAEATTMATDAPVMSDRQWVLGLENALEKIPTGRVAPEKIMDEFQEKRSNGIFDRMQARRIEEYGYTGKWHDEWGPKPEGIIERIRES